MTAGIHRHRDAGQRTAAELLERVRGMLLRPDEANSAEFSHLVRAALGTLPAAAADDAYLGDATADTGWLDRFDRLAPDGVDQHAALAEAMRALHGQLRWHASVAVQNVNAPVLLPVAAAHAVTTLYNPNALWDLVSGGTLDLERRIAHQFGALMGWPGAGTDGLFTFGGKAGILYAIRLGLNRCRPGSAQTGLTGGALPVVLTTAENHYSVRSSCSLLGLGRDAVVDVSTMDGMMSVEAFRRAADAALAAGRPIAAVVLCGGNTLDAVVDPIGAIDAAVGELVARHGLGYRPWIHFDLPLGWPWLCFRDYDFDRDPLLLPRRGAAAAARFAARLDGAHLADSSCFDLHKLGLSPYAGSMFLTSHMGELRRIFGDHGSDPPWRERGGNFRQHHSIEHSRSAAPIIAAWTALRILGKNGFRAYLAHLHELTAEFREALRTANMRVVNPDAPSLASMFVPPRPGGPGTTEQQDHYTEALFRYVTGLDGRAVAPVPIGFVPRYRPGGHGDAVSALRIYAASPLLGPADARAVVARVVRLRDAFGDAGSTPRGGRLIQPPR